MWKNRYPQGRERTGIRRIHALGSLQCAFGNSPSCGNQVSSAVCTDTHPSGHCSSPNTVMSYNLFFFSFKLTFKKIKSLAIPVIAFQDIPCPLG